MRRQPIAAMARAVPMKLKSSAEKVRVRSEAMAGLVSEVPARCGLGGGLGHLARHGDLAFLDLFQGLRIGQVEMRVLNLLLEARLVEHPGQRSGVDAAVSAVLDEDHHDELGI